jgi:hypothetical protein
MVQAAIKGLKNRESLVETPRAVMTLQLLRKARDKLKEIKLPQEHFGQPSLPSSLVRGRRRKC